MRKTAAEVATAMTDFVNTFSSIYGTSNKEFIEAMNREHRTLQQSFTRLCLTWLENCASDEYRFDGRNERAHDTCRELILGFKDKNDGIGPSNYLGHI